MLNNVTNKDNVVTIIPVWVRTALFLAVGIILIMISLLLESKGSLESKYELFWQAVTLNLGLVFISVTLVDQLWRLTGGTPIEKQIDSLSTQVARLSHAVDVIERSKEIGLDAVYDKLGNYGNQSDWLTLVKDSTDRVDLMGRTLHGWTRSGEMPDVVLNKIQRDNVKFRWLVMDKENKYLPLLVEDHINVSDLLLKKLDQVFDMFFEIHKRLPEDKKDYFQVRRFSHVPLYCSILRLDDRHFITQYLFNVTSDSSPLYCVKGKSTAWSKAYSQEFTAIWDKSQDLFVTQSNSFPTPNILIDSTIS